MATVGFESIIFGVKASDSDTLKELTVDKSAGERFIYYPELSTMNGQTLTLDRVIPKLNGVSCGINTNHGLITLPPGENHIQIQNLTRVKSTWDFRFLYK